MSEQRLIDADAFVQSLIHCKGLGRQSLTAVLEHIEKQPTIEAEPVRHGKWTDPEDDDGGTEWHCSECSFTVKTLVWHPRYSFCPNCGARMDGDAT